MNPRSSLSTRAALLFLLGSLGCAEQTVAPGAPVPPTSLCGYPRACYVKDCDDCRGGPSRCRRVLGGCGADMGNLASCQEPPRPSDPSVACPPAGVDGGQGLVCALPEAICVARGKRCDGYCVRATETCQSGAPVPPQRSDRDGGGTFCPYSDDECCPATRDMGPQDQAAATDGPAQDLRARD